MKILGGDPNKSKKDIEHAIPRVPKINRSSINAKGEWFEEHAEEHIENTNDMEIDDDRDKFPNWKISYFDNNKLIAKEVIQHELSTLKGILIKSNSMPKLDPLNNILIY